jgi:hypothetical protein
VVRFGELSGNFADSGAWAQAAVPTTPAITEYNQTAIPLVTDGNGSVRGRGDLDNSSAFIVTTTPTTTPGFVAGQPSSLSLWLKPPPGGYEYRAMALASSLPDPGTYYRPGFHFYMFRPNGTMAFDFVGNFVVANNTWAATALLNSTDWVHLALVYDGTQTTGCLKMYINGVFEPHILDTPPPSSPALYDPIDFRIAGVVGIYGFSGFMDEMVYLDRELTLDEVTALYNRKTTLQATLDSVPSAFYEMNEPSGAVLTDSSGNGLTGSIDSATFGGVGREGLCLTTTGVPMASFPVNAAFSPQPQSPWSFQFWVFGQMNTTVAGLPYLSSLDVVPYNGVHGWVDNSLVYFGLYQAGTAAYAYCSVGAFLSGQWNHFVFTKDASGVASGYKFYINGSPQGSTSVGSLTGAIIQSNPLRLGGTLAAGVKFDMFATWNRELSSGEVLALYHGAAPIATGTAVWTVPQVSGVPKMVSVTGRLGLTTTNAPSQTYLSIDGGATESLVENDINLGTLTPTGATQVKVTLEAANVYIGGDAGEGPTLWVEDGIAPGTNRRDFNPINRGMV